MIVGVHLAWLKVLTCNPQMDYATDYEIVITKLAKILMEINLYGIHKCIFGRQACHQYLLACYLIDQI